MNEQQNRLEIHETELFKEVKESVLVFFQSADELSDNLSKQGEQARKAIEVLGLANALKINNEGRRNSVLSAKDPIELVNKIIMGGGLSDFSKVYSIAKTVYTDNPSCAKFIESFESLIEKINGVLKPPTKLVLPPLLFSEYDPEVSTDVGVPDNKYIKLRSVQDAFKLFAPQMKVDKQYAGEVVGLTYTRPDGKSYYQSVKPVNPSSFNVYEKDIIDF